MRYEPATSWLQVQRPTTWPQAQLIDDGFWWVVVNSFYSSPTGQGTKICQQEATCNVTTQCTPRVVNKVETRNTKQTKEIIANRNTHRWASEWNVAVSSYHILPAADTDSHLPSLQAQWKTKQLTTSRPRTTLQLQTTLRPTHTWHHALEETPCPVDVACRARTSSSSWWIRRSFNVNWSRRLVISFRWLTNAWRSCKQLTTNHLHCFTAVIINSR